MIQRVTFRMDDIIEEIFPSLKIEQILIPIVDSDTSNDDDAMAPSGQSPAISTCWYGTTII